MTTVRETDRVSLVAEGAAGQGGAAPTAATHSVRVCFGRRWVSPELVSRLQAGSILELDCEAAAPVEVYADGKRAGLGEAVIVEGRMGIRLESLESESR